MKKCVGILALLVALVAGVIATGNIVLAADPDKTDITVIGHGGAPGCEVPEGELLFSNSSSEYRYKVQVNVTFENQTPGNSHCGCEEPYCCDEPCECEISNTFVVLEDDYREFKDNGSCMLPNCSGCDQHCDNVPPSQCEPIGDIHHCVCPYGSYSVTFYSDDQGAHWYAMPPSFRIPITEKEQNPDCPASLGCE
jgi:hypothetical protein